MASKKQSDALAKLTKQELIDRLLASLDENDRLRSDLQKEVIRISGDLDEFKVELSRRDVRIESINAEKHDLLDRIEDLKRENKALLITIRSLVETEDNRAYRGVI